MPKKIILSLIVGLSAHLGFAQTAYSILQENNIATQLNTGAVFLNDPATTSPSYEYPIGSGNHLIYSSSFWFGGTDINGSLKLSGQMYDLGKDLFPGPLTTNGSASITAPVAAQYDAVWSVSKSEIDFHVANYNVSGYTIPASILDWPAHGDVTLDQDYYLAPFVDVNNNSLYDPANGDYPLIRGDRASYMILNDKLDIHSESGGYPIGIETHFMFYQFSSVDDLENTTFVNIKLINRGTQTLYDFAVGNFFDADLGYQNDDFMGSDSSNNLLYVYNSTNTDTQYGTNPPAVGLMSLSHDLGSAGVYSNFENVTGVPLTAADYHLNMMGFFKDGTPITVGGSGYGGTIPTKFQYHGNPNNAGEWSEIGENNLGTERKMWCATEPITLLPSDEICFDFAYVIGDGGTNLENVNHLISSSQFVQSFFDQQNYPCENYESFMSVPEEVDLELIVYPQPSEGHFTILTENAFNLEIFSLEGKRVYSENNLQPNAMIEPNLSAGSYILKIFNDNQFKSTTIVVK